MGKALYRQYRPSSFEEVIGQDHITTTLKNSLSAGSIGHAYLLTGPRGLGKTSVARILAYAVNDLPYQKDSTHMDIIEIDAASNRRIDEIRTLRERVSTAPTSGKYKVYIIDEVHMLTREAFNALLKTLEEPPAHVIFILATTEIHKLPDTIISRCITFTFRPIDHDGMVKHLAYIASTEKLDIDTGALELLARHGDGSFRDSISLLDQVKNVGKKITVNDIELALGLASQEVVQSILEAVMSGQPQMLAAALETAYLYGASETNLSKQVAAQLRNDLLSGSTSFSSEDALRMLAELLTVPASPKPRAKLELCLLNQLFRVHPLVQQSPAFLPEAPAAVETVSEQIDTIETKTPLQNPLDHVRHEEHPQVLSASAETIESAESELWDEVLQKLKIQNNTLYGIARMAQAEQTRNKLLLSFKFPFHFRQVNQPKNKSIITAILEKLSSNNIELVIIQADGAKKAPKPIGTDKTISNITNIFGDSEVLES